MRDFIGYALVASFVYAWPCWLGVLVGGPMGFLVGLAITVLMQRK